MKQESSSNVNFIPLVSNQSQAHLFIQGRKAKLHHKERRETTLRKRDRVAPLIRRVKNDSELAERSVLALDKSLLVDKPGPEQRKIKCTSGTKKEEEVERAGNELDKKMKETDDKARMQVAEKDRKKTKVNDPSMKKLQVKQRLKEPRAKIGIKERNHVQPIEQEVVHNDDKNEKIFQRRGRQIEIQLPSSTSDGNETGINSSELLCHKNAFKSDVHQIRRVYLVTQNSTFGSTEEKSFTVLFPDDVDKITKPKIPNSNQASPGWLSPVPYSQLDLSFAYVTPEHSPLPSPPPTMDHIHRLKTEFEKK